MSGHGLQPITFSEIIDSDVIEVSRSGNTPSGRATDVNDSQNSSISTVMDCVKSSRPSETLAASIPGKCANPTNEMSAKRGTVSLRLDLFYFSFNSNRFNRS